MLIQTEKMQFPEVEEDYEDSKAAQIAASQKPQQKNKKNEKKDKIIDGEEQKIRDEKKR